MIKFIEESAVFDVSKKLRETLCNALSKSQCRFFFIVPDQFEFETEKTIYSELSEKGLLKELSRVNITTFSGLSREILLKAGENMPAADDVVKSVVMNKAVREQKNALSSLKAAADKPGFCEKMTRTISALKTAGIGANDLDEKSGFFLSDENKRGLNPVIAKLKDVGKIYKSYDNFLSKYSDSLDYTKNAAEQISKEDNDFFENAWVFIDCFNDFTGSQMEFIRRMISKAESVFFAFVADLQDKRENLFMRILSQRDRIISYAENENLCVETEKENYEKRLCEPLCELSGKIFKNEKSGVSPDGRCETVSARDVFEEADFVAAKIKQLCLDDGFLYRETAVLCADAECGRYIRDAFEKYEIPFFLDIPESILYKPLVNFFISLLNALRNFSVDNVLSCLKTGFYSKPSADESGKIPISNKDIDVFESYVFEWNLSAKHLKSEFKFGGENDRNRAGAEMIRKNVAEPILRLRERLKNKDGAQITKELYFFAADEVEIEKTLVSRCYGENSVFDSDAVRLNQQIWNSLSEILDVLCEELSGENITIDEYYRLFSEICANTSLAKPPQFRDSVLVGDIDRTRADGVRAVFIVGATYENLPAKSDGMGIFSQYEQELVTGLIRANAAADDIRALSLKDFKEQYSLSLYRAYRALSLASDYLCITAHEYDASQNKVSRSGIFGDIKRVFPEIKLIKAKDMGEEFYCRSVNAVKQRYAENPNSKSALALREFLENNGCENFVLKLDDIRRDNENAFEHKITKDAANRLFKLSLENKDSKIAVGATQAEKLIQCPFAFFCTRELGINEITKREFNSSNRGSALHFVMQKIFTRYKDKSDEFFRLKRGDFLRLSEEFLFDYLKTQTNGDYDDDKRTAFLFRNIASSAADLLITMQTELSVRSYRPMFFEMNISKEAANTLHLSLKRSDDESESNETGAENNIAENHDAADNAENERKTEFELLSKPLSVRLSDDTEVLIGGNIDRLDVMYAEKDKKPRLYLRVIDYKTKAKNFDKENAENGENIQMLLYLTALCRANEKNAAAQVLPGEISYIPSLNAGAAKTRLEALYLLEMNHHPNGLYIRDEIVENNLKKVTDTIAKSFDDCPEERKKQIVEEIEKSFELNDDNSVTNEDFQLLADKCIKTVTEKLEQIYGGNISAVPLLNREGEQKSEQDPCKYCALGGICKNPKRGGK